MSPLRRLLSSVLLLAACGLAAAAPRAALVTVLDGDAAVLRDEGRFDAAEGLALLPGDILVTSARTRLVRIEFPDGVALALGPDTQALLQPPLPGEAVYLLTGWAKLNVPGGLAAALGVPGLEIATRGGAAVVVDQAADGLRVFAESGGADVRTRPAGGAAQALAAGQMLSAGPGGARPEVAARPTPALVQALPRAFMDSLPARYAAFAGKDAPVPRPGALAYASAQPWLDAEPALRKAFVKRWRALARDPEFRRGLVAGLKAHPEWEPVLFPPPPPHPASTAKHRDP